MRQCGLNVARPTGAPGCRRQRRRRWCLLAGGHAISREATSLTFPCSLHQAAGPFHASVKRSSRALQAPASTSSRSSGGNGKGNGGADLRKASVEELLSGVTYWRAQQMREHNAGPAVPPSHPYEDTPPPPPSPPPPSPPVATEGAAALQHHQQQQQQQHVNGSSNGSTGDALAPQSPAPSTSPGPLPAAASGEVSEGEWQLDAASSGREASEALTAYASAMARRQPVPVHFCLKFRAQMGQRVKVVGACEQLGEARSRSWCYCCWVPQYCSPGLYQAGRGSGQYTTGEAAHAPGLKLQPVAGC
jgi:hypothetical protein